GGVEGSNGLHAEELEPHVALHGLRESLHARLCGAPELTGLRAESFVLPGELFRLLPGQPYPRAAPPVRQPVEHELGKTEPFAERVGRGHSAPRGAKAMPVNVMRSRNGPRADCRARRADG